MSVEDLVVQFRPPGRTSGARRPRLLAVAGVSLDIQPGATVSLVGESGCGKTTLGRAMLGLVPPTSGTLRFKGQDLRRIKGAARRRVRRSVQAIFQNPYQSLNPRMRIEQMLCEPIVAHRLGSRQQARDTAAELMTMVGLSPDQLRRYPHEFSGGQRQRLSIARALAVSPEFLVCDEPTSALDVSVRAQILNLLADLRDEKGLTYLLITHDLSIVGSMSDTLAVMYLGRIVEIGPAAEVYFRSLHPYTRALLSSAPLADPVEERRRPRILLGGDVPSPLSRPTGCGFRSRCWLYEQLDRPRSCRNADPTLQTPDPSSTRQTACHFSASMPATGTAA